MVLESSSEKFNIEDQSSFLKDLLKALENFNIENNNNLVKSTKVKNVVENDVSDYVQPSGVDFDFRPAISFWKTRKNLLNENCGKKAPSEILSQFFDCNECVVRENYKHVLSFAIMVELWNQYKEADDNTVANDSFLINVRIEVSIIQQLLFDILCIISY